MRTKLLSTQNAMITSRYRVAEPQRGRGAGCFIWSMLPEVVGSVPVPAWVRLVVRLGCRAAGSTVPRGLSVLVGGA